MQLTALIPTTAPRMQLQALNDKCQQLSFKETLERNARIQVYVCTDGHV